MLSSAVVGCGNISRLHIKAIEENENTVLTALCDIKRERAEGKNIGGTAAVYTDFDEMLQNEKIDVLHICTPHYLHTEMAVKALEKGIDVVLEKPCSVNREEIERLRQAQKKSGKQLAICFQNRYNKCVERAKEIISSREYGEIKCARAFVTWDRREDYYSDDWHGTKDKECGGVLINQSIHTLDLVQYLCGGCTLLSSHISNDHLKGVIEVEDTATLFMKTNRGAPVLFYATTAYGEDSEIIAEFTMERATLRIEGERLYIKNEKGEIKEEPVSVSEIFPGQKYWGTGHKALITDFYDCVLTGRRFVIDAFEGGKAMEIVAAAYGGRC